MLPTTSEKYKKELIELHNRKSELRQQLEVSSTDSIVDCAYLMRDIDNRIDEIKEKLLATQNHFIAKQKIDANYMTDSLAQDELKKTRRISRLKNKEVKMWRTIAIIATAVLMIAVCCFIFMEM